MHLEVQWRTLQSWLYQGHAEEIHTWNIRVGTTFSFSIEYSHQMFSNGRFGCYFQTKVSGKLPSLAPEGLFLSHPLLLGCSLFLRHPLLHDSLPLSRHLLEDSLFLVHPLLSIHPLLLGDVWGLFLFSRIEGSKWSNHFNLTWLCFFFSQDFVDIIVRVHKIQQTFGSIKSCTWLV